MLTRRAMVKDTECKLQRALQELKVTKDYCDQLLHEREDSEEEVKKIISKNTELKNELTGLHIKYTELLDERDQLKYIVSSFGQCSDAHEQALNRIIKLEHSLCEVQNEAQRTAHELELCRESELQSNNMNLYNELIECDSQLGVSVPALSDSNDDSRNKYMTSHKKLK